MHAFICHVEFYFPEETLGTREPALLFLETKAELLGRRTGIRMQSFSAQGQCASFRALAAANRLFQNMGVAKRDIDSLLFRTQSPDYLIPPTSCTLLLHLGISESVGTLDFSRVCSGYLYGLDIAEGLISASHVKNVFPPSATLTITPRI